MSQGQPTQRRARRTIHLPVDLAGDDVRSALTQTEFLAHVPADKLTNLIKISFVRNFKDGAPIIEQGTYGHSLFVLVRGGYKVRVQTDDGTVLNAGEFKTPSSFFGEMALLGKRRRTATILAVGDTVLVELEKTKIELLDRDVHGVLDRLELGSRIRTIRTFLEQHRYLKELDESAKKFIADNALVKVHERGTTMATQGEAVDHVVLMKSGVAKMVRTRGKAESVLAYFNAGDVVGVAQHNNWPASMISMGYVETIEIERHQFVALRAEYDELFSHFDKDVVARQEAQRELAGKNTVMAFVEDIVAEGAHEGQSLLTINLNLCIRCGNCTRACQARHGYSRMERKGKKLVRRENQEKQGSRQTILLPTSCRHCVNPECMIGCPTGAIHRTPGGEVDVHDFCIGCASCANRCPWGNITMVQVERMVSGELRTQRASKCNLCEGYSQPNCVHNCPTGAILRVDPTSFFPELRKVLGDSLGARKKKVGGDRTHGGVKFQMSKVLVPLFGLALAAALVGVYFMPLTPLLGYHDGGQLILGVAALSGMLGAVFLAVRRRMNRIPLQMGRFQMWVRIHTALGLVSLLAVMLHSRFELGGVITTMLVVLTSLIVASGVFGLLYYRWLPKRITRLEGGTQLEEAVFVEQQSIDTRRRELLDEETPEVKSVVNAIGGAAGGVMGRFSGSYDAAAAQAGALKKLKKRMDTLDEAGKRKVEQLVEDAVRAKELGAVRWLYRLRRGWLSFHITVTAILITVIALHVTAVFFFWS